MGKCVECGRNFEEFETDLLTGICAECEMKENTKMSNQGYGTYDNRKWSWRGESSDEFYPYAVMDSSMFSLKPGANVWAFAKSLKSAMETATEMMQEHGIDQVEIGVPSGAIIQIDARYVDLEEDE